MDSGFVHAGGNFGRAVARYLSGESDASFDLIHPTGESTTVLVNSLWEIDCNDALELQALASCGHLVLDVGAGLGRHSVFLTDRGHVVTALEKSDICARAIQDRGVAQVLCCDASSAEPGLFDTVLILGHGIGMFASLRAIGDFLGRAKSWLKPGGKLIVDSVDIVSTGHQPFIRHSQENLEAGREAGLFNLRIDADGIVGESFPWLYVSRLELVRASNENGLSCEIAHLSPDGRFLAILEVSNQAKFKIAFPDFKRSPPSPLLEGSPDLDRSKFDESGYTILRGALNDDLVEVTHRYLWKRVLDLSFRESDDFVTAPCSSEDPLAAALLSFLHDEIQHRTGKRLVPSYAYVRCYLEGNKLLRHVDRDACEISATLAIGHRDNDLWPIYVESSGQPVEISLRPGDLLIYRGMDVPHWRHELESGYWLQIFLHYVIDKGDSKLAHGDGALLGLGTPT